MLEEHFLDQVKISSPRIHFGIIFLILNVNLLPQGLDSTLLVYTDYFWLLICKWFGDNRLFSQVREDETESIIFTTIHKSKHGGKLNITFENIRLNSIEKCFTEGVYRIRTCLLNLWK